ncbi:unnamed protein product [Rhizophagus irregularis]|nr:unnamed protein product [Rhizophagus irregularis]
MTSRHHNKKSFLSQAKYDIQMRARVIEHIEKPLCMDTLKEILEKITKTLCMDTLKERLEKITKTLWHAQGKIGEEDDAMYGKYEGMGTFKENKKRSMYGKNEGMVQTWQKNSTGFNIY